MSGWMVVAVAPFEYSIVDVEGSSFRFGESLRLRQKSGGVDSLSRSRFRENIFAIRIESRECRTRLR
jgi:hypothetical protein